MDLSLKLRLSQLMSNFSESSEELYLLLNTNDVSVSLLSFMTSFRPPVNESGIISAAKTGLT
jgi:hypothetical protein